MDKQQIIKEKICTVIPKGQPFSYEDVSPGVSVTQDPQGNITLKEIWFQVVNQQQSTRKEDVGSNDENRGQMRRSRSNGKMRMRTRMIPQCPRTRTETYDAGPRHTMPDRDV